MAQLVLSDFLTVYDHNGNSDSMPVGYGTEEPLDKMVIDRHGVLLNLKELFNALPCDNETALSEGRVSLLAEGGYHHIFSVKMDGVKTVIARVPRIDVTNSSKEWIDSKVLGEIALSKYIAANSSIPVPAFIKSGTITSQLKGRTIKPSFFLTEKAKGKELSVIYANLSLEQKVELTKSLASELAAIFKVTVSEVGSAVGQNEDGSLLMGPVVDSARGTNPPFSAQPYSVNDLASFRIEHLRKICPADASSALDTLDAVRQHICSKIISSAFHLFHPDVRMSNIFVDSGAGGAVQVSAIIDWDLHYFLPAPLAADYPFWLRFDGYYDPQYNPRGGKTEFWWEEERETIQGLRAVFKESIQESGVEFHNNLCNGTAQRELFYWFYNWDDCESYYDAIINWSTKYI